MSSTPTDQPVSEEGAVDPCLSDGINVNAIIIRMKKEYNVKADTELANVLGTAKTTISSWRRRNSIPLDILVKAAVECMNSIDYIVFGSKQYISKPSIHDMDIDVRLMELCMYKVDKNLSNWNFNGVFDKSAQRVRSLLMEYRNSHSLLKELVGSGSCSREDFLKSLRKTFDEP